MLLQASAYYFAALRQAHPFLFLDYQQLIKNRISGLSEHVFRIGDFRSTLNVKCFSVTVNKS